MPRTSHRKGALFTLRERNALRAHVTQAETTSRPPCATPSFSPTTVVRIGLLRRPECAESIFAACPRQCRNDSPPPRLTSFPSDSTGRRIAATPSCLVDTDAATDRSSGSVERRRRSPRIHGGLASQPPGSFPLGLSTRPRAGLARAWPDAVGRAGTTRAQNDPSLDIPVRSPLGAVAIHGKERMIYQGSLSQEEYLKTLDMRFRSATGYRDLPRHDRKERRSWPRAPSSHVNRMHDWTR